MLLKKLAALLAGGAIAVGLTGCGSITTIYEADHWDDETLAGFAYNPNVSRALNLTKIANPQAHIQDVTLPEGMDYGKAKDAQWNYPVMDTVNVAGMAMGVVNPVLILSWLNARHSLDGDTTKNNCGFGLVSAKRASTWSEAAALLIKDLDAAAAKALVDMGHDKSTLKQVLGPVTPEMLDALEKAKFSCSEYSVQWEQTDKDGKKIAMRDHATSGAWTYSRNRPQIIAPKWLSKSEEPYWLVDYAWTFYTLNRDGKYVFDAKGKQSGDRRQEFLQHLIKYLPEHYWLYVPPYVTSEGPQGPYVLEKNRVNLYIKSAKGDLGDWQET